jgi:hypothetical protein
MGILTRRREAGMSRPGRKPRPALRRVLDAAADYFDADTEQELRSAMFRIYRVLRDAKEGRLVRGRPEADEPLPRRPFF